LENWHIGRAQALLSWYYIYINRKQPTMINFANATKTELEAAGYKVTVKRSQAKTRKNRSNWVKPSMNRSNALCVPLVAATEVPANSGCIQG